MPRKLHIDIETYNSVDLKDTGVYPYAEHEDFEILLLAYAVDDSPIESVACVNGAKLPARFLEAFDDPYTLKCAHNANFERICLEKYWNLRRPVSEWRCSMIKAAYCGYPFGLKDAGKLLGLGKNAKLEGGRDLIRLFCMPVKPTQANKMRTRIYPEDSREKWAEFVEYNYMDVAAERGLDRVLSKYEMPEREHELYFLDQEINDRGIKIDRELVENVLKIDAVNTELLTAELKKLTGLENPNSPSQLKAWLSEALNEKVDTLAKNSIPDLIQRAGSETVRDVLRLRQRSSKTSIKKYDKMLTARGEDDRVRGLFQFYGASKTGRWAGRLVQVQNLPRTYLEDLDLTRDAFKTLEYDDLDLMYDNVSDTLSQLIRTAFIAPEGKLFYVADFSAIEARVTAWFAGEEWRLEVFNTHGKIYEASAALMYGIPIDEVTKEQRQKGKVAELALGYQGSVGAMLQMGAESMGLTENEMRDIVNKWRRKSPNIVRLWSACEKAAVRAVKTGRRVILKDYKNLIFEFDGVMLTITLPSGRSLFYPNAKVKRGRFDKEVIEYKGQSQTTKQWSSIAMYGGKFVENIVQAFSRDILAESMLRLEEDKHKIVMHVHDEVVIEADDFNNDIEADLVGYTNRDHLGEICHIMSTPIPWAEGLPLGAEGYVSKYYKKD